MAFAERLRQLRNSAGLAQAELAAKAGVNRSAIAKLERGEREPSWATVQALAAALGVDCTAFADVQASAPEPVKAKKGAKKRKGK